MAGYIIDKYGPRRMMMIGALLGGISLIGLGFVRALPMFYLFYFLNALGYVFGGPLPVQVLISRWFDKNRGKTMGIAYLGIGIGGALVHEISAGLEKNLGWSFALSILGVIVIILALPLPLFLKNSPIQAIEPDQQPTAAPIKSILKDRNFYLLTLGSMCSIGAVGGIIQHLKLYLNDLDFSQSEAAHVMSLVLLSSLAGRVLMGYLADAIPRKQVMLLIFGIYLPSDRISPGPIGCNPAQLRIKGWLPPFGAPKAVKCSVLSGRSSPKSARKYWARTAPLE